MKNKVSVQIVIEARQSEDGKNYAYYVSDIPMFNFVVGQTIDLSNIKWETGYLIYPEPLEFHATIEEYLMLRDTEVVIHDVQYQYTDEVGWVIFLDCKQD